MSKNIKGAASAAASSSTDLATSSNAALAELLGGLDLGGIDGFDEVEQSDIKIPSVILNYKGQDETGSPVLPNVYFNTLTELGVKRIECTILLFTKSHEFKIFDESKNESVRKCYSFDRVTGSPEEGGERKCDGCPHFQWRKIDGKAKRDCGVVYNVLAVDAEGQPFFYRVKSTAVNELKTYLNKHFLGKLKGGRHIPAFAFKTVLTARMESKGSTTWAVPVFELGEMNTGPAIAEHAESARFYKEVMQPALEKASDAERHESSEPAGKDSGKSDPTSFNPSDFQDDDSTAAPAPGLF